MRRLAGAVAGDRRLLAVVLVQGATGLAAIGALVWTLELAPRVTHIERRIVEVQRIVRVLVQREGVMPGKSSPHGLAGPAPRAGVGPREGVMPGKLPLPEGLPGPVAGAPRATKRRLS